MLANFCLVANCPSFNDNKPYYLLWHSPQPRTPLSNRNNKQESLCLSVCKPWDLDPMLSYVGEIGIICLIEDLLSWLGLNISVGRFPPLLPLTRSDRVLRTNRAT